MSGQFFLGLAMLVVNQPYRGLPNRVTPIPLISYRGERLTVEGPRIAYGITKWKSVKAALVMRYRFAGFDPDDSEYLRGMHRRKDTIDGGLSLKADLPKSFGATAAITTDMLDHHKGSEWLLALDRKFMVTKKFIVTPNVEMRSESQSLADYYFGVNADEATASRPAYKVDKITNWGIGISGRYTFTERQTALLSVGREYLDTEIRGSPIVDRKFITRWLLAWNISF